MVNIILVGGGSACGKGGFVIKAKELLVDREISVICTDDYMRFGASNYKVSNETPEAQVKKEIDCCDPQYLDIKSLKTDIKKELSKGNNRILIVEGLHALIDEGIRELADLKIFMKADRDLRLIWKIQRSPWYKESIGETPEDTRRFGGCLPIALKRWSEGQKFGENKWILPTEQYADFVMCCNSWSEFDEEMKKVVEFVNIGKLPERNLQHQIQSSEKDKQIIKEELKKVVKKEIQVFQNQFQSQNNKEIEELQKRIINLSQQVTNLQNQFSDFISLMNNTHKSESEEVKAEAKVQQTNLPNLTK